MPAWLPYALIAGTLLGVLSQRKSSSPSTCAGLTSEQRAFLDRFLAADPETVLAVGYSQGLDKALVVSAIYKNATQLDELGCKPDGDRVRAKADAVAKLVEPAIQSVQTQQQHQASSGSGMAVLPPMQHLAGAYVAPEVRVGGVPGERDASPVTQATQHGVAPGTTARLDQAYGQAFASPAPGSAPAANAANVGNAPPRPPPIALLRTKARVAIRPEPVAWDDQSMGKLGFTVPANYPVGLLAFGPPACPPGWTKVELQHPDHGVVDGFTEAANLAQPPPSPPMQTRATQQPQTGKAATRSPASMPQSFQGRTRRKTKKQSRPLPRAAS